MSSDRVTIWPIVYRMTDACETLPSIVVCNNIIHFQCDDVCDVQADYSSSCLDFEDYCDDYADCEDAYDEGLYWCWAAAKKRNVSSKKGASKRTTVQRLLSKLLVKKKK